VLWLLYGCVCDWWSAVKGVVHIQPTRAEVLLRYDCHFPFPSVFAFETYRLIVGRPHRPQPSECCFCKSVDEFISE